MDDGILKKALRPKKLDKDDYQKRSTELRYRMVELQNRIRGSKIPVVILFAGVDGAGKHETVDLMNEWMDPRWLKTRAYGEYTEEERLRPPMWRYWRDLPAGGEIGLFLSAWTSRPLLDRVKGLSTEKQFEDQLETIRAFEKTLCDNGYLVMKFWMHLDQDHQKDRLVKLSSDELRAWQIKSSDWENLQLYERFMESADAIVAKTDGVPWKVIDGSFEKSRSLFVAEEFVKGLEARLKKEEQKKTLEKSTKSIVPHGKRLADVNLSQKVSKDIYKTEMKRLQSKLFNLQQEAYRRNIPSVLVFEGWDAAGKGGAIRRLTKALDARQYEVTPIAAPTQEELNHHYLWRFWKHLPRGGRVAIFDRSWYGRVLVERVEGFADKASWHRAFEEIKVFEKELTDYGAVVCKFWLHISKEEQLERFEDRAKVAYKAWKLCDDDWRNRDQWESYLDAAEDMFGLTETKNAPWSIIPANQKQFARLKVISTLCKALESRLESEWDKT
jgi:AMP-polyphosphate phosphotransferase